MQGMHGKPSQRNPGVLNQRVPVIFISNGKKTQQEDKGRPVNVALTNIEAITYLLSEKEGEKMKGKIRPISIQNKCPKCKQPFKELSKLGFICEEHLITPRKFYLDVSHEGKRYRIFTDKYNNVLDSYSSAKSLLKQINSDLENRSFNPSQYVRKDRENYYLEARWDEFEKRHKNRKYLYQIAFAKEYVFKHFRPSQDIRDIQQSDISLFAEAIPLLSKKQEISGKTIKNITGVLLSLLNYNHSIGMRASKLSMPHIEVVHAPKNIPEISESLKVIEKIEEPFRIIYLFLLTHLCRPADARALQARHFDFANDTVTIEQGFSGNELSTTKTKKPYRIPIHRSLRDRLQTLCISKMPDDFTFTYTGKRWGDAKLRELWNKAAKKAGLPIKLYQGVKHASISYVASESGDIYNTSKLTGHSNVSTTEIYTDKGRIEKLRKIQATINIPEQLL
jgi:integrase